MDEAAQNARVVAFLAGLTALSREHGVTVYGCGCCGSPVLDVRGEPLAAGSYRVNAYGGHYDALRFLAAGERDTDGLGSPVLPSEEGAGG